MPEIFRQFVANPLSLTGNLGIQFSSEEIDPNWVRWTHASVNKHFLDRRGIYDLYLEGDERTYQDNAEFAELRIDGPYISHPCKDYFILEIEINILIQTHMDKQELYKTQRAIGIFSKAFSNVICAYKYGDDQFDDQTLWGKYIKQRRLPNPIDINHFGIIKEDTRLTQTTIEGHYRLEVCK